MHFTIWHGCNPGFTVLWFKQHKWRSYDIFTSRTLKWLKSLLLNLKLVMDLQNVFVFTIWGDCCTCTSNLDSKILIIKDFGTIYDKRLDEQVSLLAWHIIVQIDTIYMKIV